MQAAQKQQHDELHKDLKKEMEAVTDMKTQLRDIKWLLMAAVLFMAGNSEAATKLANIVAKATGH